MSDKEIIQNATLHIIRPQRYQMAFWGLVILIGGIAIGAATTVMVVGRGSGEPMRGFPVAAQRMVEGMARELQLTPEQQRLIEPLVKQHMAKLDEIRSKAQPQITEQFKLMHDEIAKILTPEQLMLWEARLKRIPEDFRPPMPPDGQRFRDGGPEGPGGRQQPGPQNQPPDGPTGPAGQPQRGQPMTSPPGAPSGEMRMQEDRVAATVLDNQRDSSPAQAQPVADAAAASAGDQPPQQGQDDGTPPPPPDDGGGPGPMPQDGGPGGPMGPPPD
jgi:hypothetical protein